MAADSNMEGEKRRIGYSVIQKREESGKGGGLLKMAAGTAEENPNTLTMVRQSMSRGVASIRGQL